MASSSEPLSPAATGDAERPAAVAAGDAPAVTAPAFPVVAIGASAGGLAAFGKFLAAVPPDSGMAFVLVQHLSPQHESQLAQLLARDSRLPVVEAGDGMAIQPDHVYVIPPNASMALAQGVLRVTPRETGPGLHLSIDFFMRSLARECASRAIGVVLTGTGSDGTLGLAEIRAAGGITFAQAPASAENGEMPANAIASGCIDSILTADEIARAVTTMGRHPYLRGEAAGEDGDVVLPEAGYPAILATLKTVSDVDFSLYRTATIQRRIHRRMVLRGAVTMADYATVLTGDAQEKEALHKDVLINVTSFFRDQVVFDALRTLVFPRLVADRAGDAGIRIWVVACSTGQEAYSLAMELVEHFDGRPLHPPIQIFATDISEGSLAIARAGVYPASIESEVSPERLRRHFTRSGDGYRINKSIRDVCVFARHDVTADTPFSKIDLITCRNVLIYLTPVLQMRVIPTFHYTLNPGGYLVLGSSETVGRASALFEAVDGRNRVYVKKPTVARQHPPVFPAQRRASADPLAGARVPSQVDLQRAADRIVLGRYAPAGVLVDGRLNVIQFRGTTSDFLEPASGEASLSLLRMVPFALAQELTRAIAEARARNVVIRRQRLPLRDEQRLREIDIEVSMVRLPGAAEASILILFAESPPLPPPPPAADSAPAVSAPGTDAAVSAAAEDQHQLRQELAAANDYLQALIEENHEINDALTMANDEAVSHNEELRCTNEELQTAKEEVESANEELATVNEELRHRNAELTLLSNDLSNLLDGIDLPIVMLGRDLRVRRITQAVAKTLRLSARDIGRHIGSLDIGFPQHDLETTAAEVMCTRAASAIEVRDRDGRWCSLRVTPYRTEGDGVEGAVITCIDIQAVKRTQEILRQVGDFAKGIIETVADPLLVLDAQLRVHTANRAFYRVLRLTPEATLGRHLSAVGGGEWDLPALGLALAGILHGGAGLDDFEITRDFAGLGQRSLRLNARLLEAAADGKRMIVLAIADITGLKRLTDELISTTADLRRSNADLDQFAAVASHDLQEPLRTIASFLDLLELRLGGELDGKSREFMGYVSEAAQRMRDRINAILEYARVGHQPIAAELVDAGAIRDAAATVTCGELPAVVGDAQLLARLVQNLVGNAIKFRSPQRPAVITIAARASGSEWIFLVADNGIGIRPEDTTRIFALFQRLHAVESYQGAGIGLATCKSIVERHGGRLWVESVVDAGTTFLFTMPKP